MEKLHWFLTQPSGMASAVLGWAEVDVDHSPRLWFITIKK